MSVNEEADTVADPATIPYTTPTLEVPEVFYGYLDVLEGTEGDKDKDKESNPLQIFVIDQPRVTIGRDNNSDLSFNHLKVSRQQYELSFTKNDAKTETIANLKNLSTRKTSVLNGKDIAPGDSVVLNHGDVFSVIDYNIRWREYDPQNPTGQIDKAKPRSSGRISITKTHYQGSAPENKKSNLSKSGTSNPKMLTPSLKAKKSKRRSVDLELRKAVLMNELKKAINSMKDGSANKSTSNTETIVENEENEEVDDNENEDYEEETTKENADAFPSQDDSNKLTLESEEEGKNQEEEVGALDNTIVDEDCAVDNTKFSESNLIQVSESNLIQFSTSASEIDTSLEISKTSLLDLENMSTINAIPFPLMQDDIVGSVQSQAIETSTLNKSILKNCLNSSTLTTSTTIDNSEKNVGQEDEDETNFEDEKDDSEEIENSDAITKIIVVDSKKFKKVSVEYQVKENETQPLDAQFNEENIDTQEHVLETSTSSKISILKNDLTPSSSRKIVRKLAIIKDSPSAVRKSTRISVLKDDINSSQSTEIKYIELDDKIEEETIDEEKESRIVDEDGTEKVVEEDQNNYSLDNDNTMFSDYNSLQFSASDINLTLDNDNSTLIEAKNDSNKNPRIDDMDEQVIEATTPPVTPSRKSPRPSVLYSINPHKVDLNSSLQQKVEEVNSDDELSQSNEEPKIQENNTSVIKSIPLQNKVEDHDSLKKENIESNENLTVSDPDPISEEKGILSTSTSTLIQDKFTKEEFNKINSAKVVIKKLDLIIYVPKLVLKDIIPTNKRKQSIQIIENESQVHGVEESNGKKKEKKIKENVSVAEGQNTTIPKRTRGINKLVAATPPSSKPTSSNEKFDETKEKRKRGRPSKNKSIVVEEVPRKERRKSDEPKESRKRGASKNDSVEEPSNVIKKRKGQVIEELKEKRRRGAPKKAVSEKEPTKEKVKESKPVKELKGKKEEKKVNEVELVTLEDSDSDDEPKSKRTRGKEAAVTAPDASSSKKSKKMDQVKDQVSEEIDKPKEKKKRGAPKKGIAAVEQEPSKEKRNVATKEKVKEPEVEPKRKTKDVTNDEAKAGTSKVEKKKSKVEKTKAKETEDDLELEDVQTASKRTRGNKKEIAPPSSAAAKQQKKAKRTIEKKSEVVVEIPTETKKRRRGAPKKSTVTAVEEPKESRKRGAPKNESVTEESSKGKDKRKSGVIEEPKEKRSRGAPKKEAVVKQSQEKLTKEYQKMMSVKVVLKKLKLKLI